MDIVEQLRIFSEPVGGGSFSPKDMAKEAANEIEHYRKDNIRLKTDKMVLFRALMKIRAIEGGNVFEMIKEIQNIANIAIKEMR